MFTKKRSEKKSTILVILISTIILSSCISTVGLQRAADRLDRIYANENEVILRKYGTRFLDMPHSRIIMAAKKALVRIKFVVVGVDENGSMILGKRLLKKKDITEEIRAAENPRIQKIYIEEIGQLGKTAGLTADGLVLYVQLLISRTASGGSKVQIQRLWMEDTKSAKRGFSIGEQLAPTALQTGVDEFWSAFDEELNLAKHDKSFGVQGDVREPSKWKLPPK